MANRRHDIPKICKTVERMVLNGNGNYAWSLLRNRGAPDLRAFLEDAASGHISTTPRLVCADLISNRDKPAPKSVIPNLLRERKFWGLAPVRVCQGRSAFNAEIANQLEDSFVRQSEWTDCCGDISTFSWTGENTFVCGAIALSDSRNMQYNRPGNLLLGSTSLDTLRAVDGHRIPRPIIEQSGDSEHENVNAREGMRTTQDPWLYTSVVSTAYSYVSGCTFTASFDQTVKVWKVADDGSSMDFRGAWEHDGKVNFVVTSNNHNKVATASDVSSNAIRIYNFDEHNIANTPYDTYSGNKAQEQAVESAWAYFPATIQWGRAEVVADLLAVGYSPRSVTGYDGDIPDDKKNSGELCVWDTHNGQRMQISAGRKQNVFEVIWHPSQAMLLAATSQCNNPEPEIKTQIRLFAMIKYGNFQQIKTLDCPALDINELTIQPTNIVDCYVSASCTDGNTYVWDTAQGDKAIHILGHGISLDNPLHDVPLEVADIGVKFASWGRSTGRFYTGSSDGKVKAWNVRAPKGEAFIRTVISLTGGVSAGAFSRDFSKLIIGDATGKVHLIAVDDLDDSEDPTEEKKPRETANDRVIVQSKGGNSHGPHMKPVSIALPKVIIPHAEPQPPPGYNPILKEEQAGQIMARSYIDNGQLVIHPNRTIGAVQGPNYADALLCCYEAHNDNDGTKPLQPKWKKLQRYYQRNQTPGLNISRLSLGDVGKSSDESDALHERNKALDFDPGKLSKRTRERFTKDGIDLEFEEMHSFELELAPRSRIFRRRR